MFSNTGISFVFFVLAYVIGIALAITGTLEQGMLAGIFVSLSAIWARLLDMN